MAPYIPSYIHEPPEPVPNQDEPIPVDIKDEQLSSLLPWLALGWAPKTTNGAANACGFRALAQAFDDLIRVVNEATGNQAHQPKILKWTDFRAMISEDANSPYRRAVDQLQSTTVMYSLDDDQAMEEYWKRMFTKSFISFEQIQALVIVGNKHYGTNFKLGTITVGYRGRYDPKKEEKVWESKVVVKTCSSYFESSFGNPTLWLLNDGGEGRSDSWRDKHQSLAHWESFGSPDSEGSTQKHRDLIRGWNLAAQISDDVQIGVWMVTTAQDGGGDRLEVRVGTFVREAPPPPGLSVPEGVMYMQYSDSTYFGTIPEKSLRRVTLHPQAPQILETQTATPAPTPGKKSIKKSPKTSAKSPAKSPAKLPAKTTVKIPAKTPAKAPKPTPKADLTDPSLFPGIKPLLFWRAGNKGALMRKDGMPINKSIGFEDKFIKNDFVPYAGQWLLNLDSDVLNPGSWRRVRTIDGREGEVASIYLQDIRNPWGFPATVKQHAGHEIHDDWDDASIEQEARKRGLLKGTDTKNLGKAALFEKIEEWEASHKTPLKMVWFKDDYYEEGQIEFLQGEIVYVETVPEDDDPYVIVTDYRGQEGVVKRRWLRSFADNPWGINMAADNKLDAQLANPAFLAKADARDGFAGPAFTSGNSSKQKVQRIPVRDRKKVPVYPRSPAVATTKTPTPPPTSSKKRPLEDSTDEDSGKSNPSSPVAGLKKKMKKTSLSPGKAKSPAKKKK